MSCFNYAKSSLLCHSHMLKKPFFKQFFSFSLIVFHLIVFIPVACYNFLTILVNLICSFTTFVNDLHFPCALTAVRHCNNNWQLSLLVLTACPVELALQLALTFFRGNSVRSRRLWTVCHGLQTSNDPGSAVWPQAKLGCLLPSSLACLMNAYFSRHNGEREGGQAGRQRGGRDSQLGVGEVDWG